MFTIYTMSNEADLDLGLRVSPAAAGPLYEQIVRGIKRAIGEGRLKPGGALPSFRALAEDLLVSLITVKRAYEQLEHEGIIYRKQGIGTFISEEGVARHKAAKRGDVIRLLREAREAAAEAGIGRRELARLFQETAHHEDANVK